MGAQFVPKKAPEGFEPSTLRLLGVRSNQLSYGAPCLAACDRTQVVTGLDLKSSGLCPRRFEPCRSRFWPRKSRREGGIEPLRVTPPTGLKPATSTS